MHEQAYNGQLSDESRFDLDPWSGDDALIQQRLDYLKRISILPKVLEKSQMTNPWNSSKL